MYFFDVGSVGFFFSVSYCFIILFIFVMFLYIVYFFFFFLAEYGIRDVTGFQSCAPPIMSSKSNSHVRQAS